MTQPITTEAALTQFLRAVEEGARPWRVDAACEETLRRELLDPFDAAVQAGHWPSAEKKMMRVGHYVGALGALLTESRQRATEPGDLDLDAVLRASGVVQALVCYLDTPAVVAGSRPVAAGRFCRPGQFGLSLDVAQARRILTGL
jgi:hypothetical protein